MRELNSSRWQLFCLGVTVLIDQVGVLIMVPIMPDLLSELSGLSIEGNAVIQGWLIASYAVMQFLFAPLLGALSDRYGRRPVLLLSFFVFTVVYLLMFFVKSIEALFVVRMIAGLVGSSMGVSLAAAADLSCRETKTKNYALLFSFVGLGLIFGPITSGLTIGFGIRVPFLVASALSFGAFLFVFFVFSETLQEKSRRSWVFKTPLGCFYQFFKVPGLGVMIVGYFLSQIAYQTPIVLWSFFTAHRFHWSSQDIAHSLIAVGVCLTLVQGFLVNLIHPILGDKKVCYLSFFLSVVYLICLAFNTYSWVFYALILVQAFAGMGNSVFLSIYTSQVDEDHQGSLQGVISSLSSMSAIIAPLMGSYLFALGIHSGYVLGDGFPMLVSVVLVMISVVLFTVGLSQIRVPPLSSKAKNVKIFKDID